MIAESDVAEFFRDFNWFDAVLGVVALATVFIGWSLGFYRQLAIFFSLIVGVVLAALTAHKLAATAALTWLEPEIGGGGTQMVAYLACLLAPFLLALVSFKIFPEAFGGAAKFLDGLLGSVLGLGIVAALFAILMLGSFHLREHWLKEPVVSSYIGSRLAHGARIASGLFPADFHSHVVREFRVHLPESGPGPAPAAGTPPAKR